MVSDLDPHCLPEHICPNAEGKYDKPCLCFSRIIDNVRGELQKRQWIIFDGDVDPEWVENLNSVLDDSKLLTLPNGERLAIPPNVSLISNYGYLAPDKSGICHIVT